METESLRHDERITPVLRELYRKHGFRRYRMSRFEEYDFYAENRSFLLGGSVSATAGNGLAGDDEFTSFERSSQLVFPG